MSVSQAVRDCVVAVVEDVLGQSPHWTDAKNETMSVFRAAP
jgi:hypothetical protein